MSASQHPGRVSGNDFFVPEILDGSGTFPFLLLSYLFFIPKRFQKQKYPLLKKGFFSGTQNKKLFLFVAGYILKYPKIYTHVYIDGSLSVSVQSQVQLSQVNRQEITCLVVENFIKMNSNIYFKFLIGVFKQTLSIYVTVRSHSFLILNDVSMIII